MKKNKFFLFGTIKSVAGEDGKKKIEVVASDETKDRHGEKIRVDGWDLKNFKKNPVMLTSHAWYDLPVGKWLNIRTEDGKLIAEAKFAGTAKGQEVQSLVEDGFLGAVSVGGIVKARDEKDPSIITEMELLEISWVSLPANPSAMIRALQKGIRFGFAMPDEETDEKGVPVKLNKEDVQKMVDEMLKGEGKQIVTDEFVDTAEKNNALVEHYKETMPEYRKLLKRLQKTLNVEISEESRESELKQIADVKDAVKLLKDTQTISTEGQETPDSKTKAVETPPTKGLSPEVIKQAVADEVAKVLKKYFV